MARRKVDQFTGANVVVTTPSGELITLAKISVELPDYVSVENGVAVMADVDASGSFTVKTSTLKALLADAQANGKPVQESSRFDYINIDNASATPGEGTLTVTLKDVHYNLKLSEMDRVAGNALDHDIPFSVAGDVEIDGVKLLRERATVGI